MQMKRYVHCPTCRARTGVDDFAYIDGSMSNVKDETEEIAAGEARLHVKGSYGTKVSISVLRCLSGSRLFEIAEQLPCNRSSTRPPADLATTPDTTKAVAS